MTSIRLPSFAKVNLGLIIKGKRGDGFHEIETLLQQIDLKDELQIQTLDEPIIKMHCTHPDIPLGEENICVRAAYLLQNATGVQKGAEIFLNKMIPIGAGLGGGSSNGAVVLLGLNRVWNLNLKSEQLLELASQLGSDVPFFIYGGAALAKGRGENLTTVNLEFDFPVLIIYPNIKIMTEWAYAQLNLSLTMKKKYIKLAHFKDRNFNDVDFYKIFKNDFEEIVFKKYPVLSDIKNELQQKKAIFVSLSGSGSTIFGIFRREIDALNANKQFQRQYRTNITRPVKWGYGQIHTTP